MGQTEIWVWAGILGVTVCPVVLLALSVLYTMRVRPSLPTEVDASQTVQVALAPMDALLLAMTMGVGAVVMFVPVFGAPVLLMVWLLFRPTHFELSREGIGVRWPFRSTCIELSTICGAEILDRSAFRQRYGYGMRVGAGGFGGGFGLLVTPKQTFSMYVSRMDGLVLIHTNAGRSWLITPETPELFLQHLGAYVRAYGSGRAG